MPNNFSQKRLLSNLSASKQWAENDSVDRSPRNENEQITFHNQPVGQSSEQLVLERRVQESFGQCDQNGNLNPLDWLRYEDARAHLSERRSNVIRTENDFDDNAIRALAETYLSLAMGAEAGALLGSLDTPTDADFSLIALSKFVDGDTNVRLIGLVPEVQQCEELIVWRVLASGENQSEVPIMVSLSETQVSQIRSDFDQWPAALKGVFAAPLARALAAAGAADSASFSLRRSENEAEQKTGDRAISAAFVAQTTDDQAAAIELLEPIVSADSDRAPEAAIALTEIILEQGKKLKPSQVSALESYQEEYKGTELERDLIRARLRSAINEGEFGQASDLIAEYAALAKANQVDLVLDEIGEAIHATASDSVFLKEAVSLPEQDFARMALTIQNSFRERMTALGFTDLAEQLGMPRTAAGMKTTG